MVALLLLRLWPPETGQVGILEILYRHSGERIPGLRLRLCQDNGASAEGALTLPLVVEPVPLRHPRFKGGSQDQKLRSTPTATTHVDVS